MSATFIKGAVIPLEVELRDKDTGALKDPANGATITVVDPLGTKKVTAQAMTKVSTGIYYYNLTLATADESGTWEFEVTSTDGSKKSVEQFSFNVKDAL